MVVFLLVAVGCLFDWFVVCLFDWFVVCCCSFLLLLLLLFVVVVVDVDVCLWVQLLLLLLLLLLFAVAVAVIFNLLGISMCKSHRIPRIKNRVYFSWRARLASQGFNA
ncbi:unnamed protein product [Polarella glacialis]|uniref:Transmembrane protein n=1 Tax=Polarella glacialis TaxID=89957 RepID=A0A813F7P9_POLGL|nr:unnamed protein product [Polarella glacialis]